MSPLLQVVNADATPEEVAAIVAVVTAMGSAGSPPEPPRSQWAAPAHRLRRPLLPGVDAWRASAFRH